eukprot:10696659-Lingulodinium_polyedra.AAC.1
MNAWVAAGPAPDKPQRRRDLRGGGRWGQPRESLGKLGGRIRCKHNQIDAAHHQRGYCIAERNETLLNRA